MQKLVQEDTANEEVESGFKSLFVWLWTWHHHAPYNSSVHVPASVCIPLPGTLPWSLPGKPSPLAADVIDVSSPPLVRFMPARLPPAGTCNFFLPESFWKLLAPVLHIHLTGWQCQGTDAPGETLSQQWSKFITPLPFCPLNDFSQQPPEGLSCICLRLLACLIIRFW